jgi:hypothetical protein
VVGAEVVVKGLTSNAGKGFNGRVGRLVHDKSAEKRQRLRIKLAPVPGGKKGDGEGGAGELVAAKLENVELTTGPEADSTLRAVVVG